MYVYPFNIKKELSSCYKIENDVKCHHSKFKMARFETKEQIFGLFFGAAGVAALLILLVTAEVHGLGVVEVHEKGGNMGTWGGGRAGGFRRACWEMLLLHSTIVTAGNIHKTLPKSRAYLH